MEHSAAQAGRLVSRRDTSFRLPTLFLSHGSPMHAIEPGAAGRAWAAIARELPRPRAILIASAHWETSIPLLTGNPTPQTIHDFGGFPDELFQLQYAAPGDPELAEEAVALLKDAGITAGIDGCRGRDHGAWVPLRWMYPEADVPVVQLSIQPELGAAHQLRVGRALAPLADDSVLIVGSGHATHNLRDWMSNPRRQEPLRYAQAFSEWLHDRLIAHDIDSLVAWREQAPEAARAHPSDEHFLPLFIALGAAAGDAKVARFVEGFEAGALAMDSYRFDPR
ncbi:MAG TPA: class III extradiol ring-cleavage dioxygenase [Casimicrobiaceae bacterium]|jgi:4,5-DOPA dioxygenase extradiol|nr:class III extradiol ring-cleavage dioxygenase [Casimicrobiaceae bacterium]